MSGLDLELLDLHPTHLGFRDQKFPGVSDAAFAFWCATNWCALPQDKLEQWPMHMPGLVYGNSQGGWPKNNCPMVVLPAPSAHDFSTYHPMSDEAGQFFYKELTRAGLDPTTMFITHAVRFAMPEGRKSYLEGHKRSCRALLRADVMGIRPRAVLVLGADALKAFFGRNAKVDDYRSAWYDWHGIPMYISVSHRGFMSTQAGLDVFRMDLDEFQRGLITGQTERPNAPELEYVTCMTFSDCCRELDKLIADPPEWLAYDTEFGNRVAREEFTEVRSVQLSWKPYQSLYLGLLAEGGDWLHSRADYQVILDKLCQVLTHPKTRLIGHHLRVDVQRASEMDINIDAKLETGFDTMLVNHLMRGDDQQSLEQLSRRYAPDLGPYWKDVHDWYGDGRKAMLDRGYMDVPDELLIPYAQKDTDVTFRAFEALREELKGFPTLEALYWDLVAPTSLMLLDVERHGMLVDEERRMQLYELYEKVHRELLAEFREEIRWPTFSPGSVDQLRIFLYSQATFFDKKPAVAPEGAVLLDLQPPFNTDKYPKEWNEIVADGVEAKHSPSTKSAALDLLYAETGIELVRKLKQLSVLGKYLNTYLSPRRKNEYGVYEDGKGFAQNIDEDGRVRTNLWQTSSTGRQRSSKPNLQTSPKKQEETAQDVMIERLTGLTPAEYAYVTDDDRDCVSWSDYLIPQYRVEIPTWKSCIIAAEDHYLVEIDFSTAEMCVLAYASGDEVLTKIVDLGRDLHSESACRAFKTPELPELDAALAFYEDNPALSEEERLKLYVRWAKSFKKKHGGLRVAAKSVNFG